MRDGAVVALEEVLARDLPVRLQLELGPVAKPERVDVDDVREQLATIRGAPPDLASPPPGCRFHPRCPFVQPDCVSGAFPLRPLGGERATACIHPDLAAEDVRREPVIAGA
jgi:oligopeptide/dipeptide ABC transporter ATP-binding protein